MARQTCSNFYEVRSASAKPGVHAGNMKLNTQNETCISIRRIVFIISKCNHVQ